MLTGCRTAISRHLCVCIGKLLSGCDKFIKNNSYLLQCIAILHEQLYVLIIRDFKIFFDHIQ